MTPTPVFLGPPYPISDARPGAHLGKAGAAFDHILGQLAGASPLPPPVEVELTPGAVIEVSAQDLADFARGPGLAMQPGETLTLPIRLVDSLGNAHDLTATVTRLEGENEPAFAFDLTVDGGEVAGGTAGKAFSLLRGSDASAPPGLARFDAAGSLVALDLGSGPADLGAGITLAVPGFTGGAEAQTVTLKLEDESSPPVLPDASASALRAAWPLSPEAPADLRLAAALAPVSIARETWAAALDRLLDAGWHRSRASG